MSAYLAEVAWCYGEFGGVEVDVAVGGDVLSNEFEEECEEVGLSGGVVVWGVGPMGGGVVGDVGEVEVEECVHFLWLSLVVWSLGYGAGELVDVRYYGVVFVGVVADGVEFEELDQVEVEACAHVLHEVGCHGDCGASEVGGGCYDA